MLNLNAFHALHTSLNELLLLYGDSCCFSFLYLLNSPSFIDILFTFYRACTCIIEMVSKVGRDILVVGNAEQLIITT